MASGKLIKTLEKKGFFLEFPDYQSNEEIIIEILKDNNSRITISLPIFLTEYFDYSKIISKLNHSEKCQFNKSILISAKISKLENINNSLRDIIKKNKIKADFTESEFKDYYDSFKESRLNKDKSEQKIIEKQSKFRLNLDMNKSLKIIFSPAKIRIMEKIFNHEKLTNTELKYYYKSISNINKAVLNPSIQDYLRIIEISRKEVLGLDNKRKER